MHDQDNPRDQEQSYGNHNSINYELSEPQKKFAKMVGQCFAKKWAERNRAENEDQQN